MRSHSSAYSPLTIALAGSMVIATAMGFGRFAYTPLLPGMIDTLGWSLVQAGDVASTNYLGYMAGAMLAAVFVHRTYRHRVLAVGLIASALTTAAGMFVTSYPAWLSIRFLSGLASAFCLVICSAMVIEVFSRHSRPQLGSLYFGGVSVGIIVSVLILEYSRYLQQSVFEQWGILGLISGISMAMAWVVLRTLKMTTVPVSSKQAGTLMFLNTRLSRLIIAYGLFGFGYVVTATFIVTIARSLGDSLTLEPVSWITVGLVGGPSLFFWQFLSTRLGLINTLRITFAVEAIGVIIAGSADSYSDVVIGAACLGGTFMAITALGLVAARRIAGDFQDQAVAWMTASFAFGQLLGPGIAGRMAEASGSFWAPSALAASLLLIGIFLMQTE